MTAIQEHCVLAYDNARPHTVAHAVDILEKIRFLGVAPCPPQNPQTRPLL